MYAILCKMQYLFRAYIKHTHKNCDYLHSSVSFDKRLAAFFSVVNVLTTTFYGMTHDISTIAEAHAQTSSH